MTIRTMFSSGCMAYSTSAAATGKNIAMTLFGLIHPGDTASKKKSAMSGTYNRSASMEILQKYLLSHTSLTRNIMSLSTRMHRKTMLQNSIFLKLFSFLSGKVFTLNSM